MSEQNIIVELKVFERGSLKAFGDVTFPTQSGELTVKGFRVMQKDGEAPWVAFPTSNYVNKEGKRVDNQILEPSKGLKKTICDLILAEYKTKTESAPF